VLVPFVMLLLYVTMGRAVAVARAVVPMAAMIMAVFGKGVAQQAACGGAADGVKRVTLRDDGAGGGTQAGANQGVVGFAVAGVGTAGHGKGQQANQADACDMGSYVHVRLHSIA